VRLHDYSPSAGRWRLWPALALIVLPFLGLIALQGYQALDRFPQATLSQRMVSHSFEVILTAQALRSALQDAERGQRGFLLTGQSPYLEPYETAVREAPALLARLTELTASESDQRRRVAVVARPIAVKLNELQRTIKAYRSRGPDAARRIVETNTGLDAMRSIVAAIDSVVATERQARSRQMATLVAQERTMQITATASAALASLLMLSGLTLAVLSFRKGRRLQGEILHANRQLEERNVDLARASELAREATEEAARAERAKGRFLATASHDLRQPLQAVSLLNGALRRVARDPSMADALSQQDEAIGTMSRLLNALLDISKLESGVISPEPAIVAVAELLATLEREFRGIAASKGLELRVAACEAYVHTDPALLQQLLRNLVSNAIKYTNEGSVWLRAVADSPFVRIEVTDSGIGIPPDQIRLIGEEFYQIGVPSNRTREGYGLGLSIVRRLVRLLSLEFEASSEVGKGSTFSVRIRESIAPAAAPALPAASAAPCDVKTVRASILLIEDDADVRNATRMLLRTDGYEVMAASSLAEAVQELRAGGAIDLLVTDFHLAAGESGVQVISRLREQINATLKAILITGDTSSAVRELAQDSHLRVVSKPVHAEEFLRVVRQLIVA
jgi:two-component system, sensor histidine kinase